MTALVLTVRVCQPDKTSIAIAARQALEELVDELAAHVPAGQIELALVPRPRAREQLGLVAQLGGLSSRFLAEVDQVLAHLRDCAVCDVVMAGCRVEDTTA